MFIFKIILDTKIHNLHVYKKKIYQWLKKKAEIDDFYERFLAYFKKPDKYDDLYFYHVGKDLETNSEIPIESVLLIMLSLSSKMLANFLRPTILILLLIFDNFMDNQKQYGETWKSKFWQFLAF